MHREPLLAVILGPTASGKTSLSISLATRFRGEIVNCDSVALYREFFIGTAKPSSEERSRVPHHLLDIVDPTAYVTAGEYSRMARQVLGEIQSRRTLPIVVGGTGLYLRALLEGLFPGPERSEQLRDKLRRRARQAGAVHLHRILQRLDSVAAAKIHPNDTPKLIRAIEVCLAGRRPMTDQWGKGRDALKGFRIIRIGLEPSRADLYDRINRRVCAMFEAGLLEETGDLLNKYGDDARPLGSIGYREAVQFIRGELSRDAAISAVQQAQRHYSKRQMTWFRREPDVHWLNGFGDNSDVEKQASELIRLGL